MIFNLSKRTQKILNDKTTKSSFARFLPYVFALIIMFGVFTYTNKAEAAPFGGCRIGGMQGSVNLSIIQSDCLPPNAWDGSVDQANPGAPAAAPRLAPGAGVAGPTASAGGGDSTKGCSLSSPGACAMTVLAAIAYLIMQGMSLILWISGSLLTFVLDETIIKMAESIKGMTGIDITWRVVRDVVNIFFIFILVYEGILIIISQSSIDKAKQIIVGVIITSVLINFSVFFTKVIIDASNIATIGFYKSIYQAGQNQGNTTINVSETEQKNNNGISGAFMNSLKISSFYDVKVLTELQAKDSYKLMLIGIGGSILFLVLAFVFFAISMMFIVRYVAFLVLLMFSPLGFIGFGLPKLKDLQSKWWDALIGQALFAPIYMFLTWIVLTLITSPGFFQPEGGWTDLFTGKNNVASPSSVGLIINFVIIIALAIFTLTKAREISNKSSTMIGSMTGKLTTFAGGAVMGGSAMALRNTVGRAGSWAANNEKLKNLAARDGVGGFAGKLALKTSAGATKATFDGRSSLGSLSDTLGVKTDFGKSGKTTYKSVMDEKLKKQEELAKMLKPDEAVANKTKQAKAEVVKTQGELLEPEFIKRDKEEKDKHLNSTEYKNSDVYKNAEAERLENEAKERVLKTETEQETKLDKELRDVEEKKKSASYTLDAQKRKEIDDEIKAKQIEVETNKKKIESLRKEIADNNTNAKAREKYENDWVSKEKKEIQDRLERLKKAEESADKYEKSVKKAYVERIDTHATNIEKGNMFWNFVTNGIGYDTDSERRTLATKIRGTSTEKSDEVKFAELAAKIAKKEEEKKAKETETGTDETKKTDDKTKTP